MTERERRLREGAIDSAFWLGFRLGAAIALVAWMIVVSLLKVAASA